MSEVSTIGLDLAKSVFQPSGRWRKIMCKLMIVLPFAVLALAGIGVGGCCTKSADVRYEYPAPDEERVRPNSPIPQMGTDGFVEDD